MGFSKNQIDHLGIRLKKGNYSETDLKMLDEYRRSFGEAYEEVITAIRMKLKLEPTGRSAKSTPAVVEKLRRETIRLSQIQDIAGCRIVVDDTFSQKLTARSLRKLFANAIIADRTKNPSYGYRAVHVIAKISGKPIEIQVRSLLQHLWAECSEKLSDSDPLLKYGGGDAKTKELLQKLSELVASFEGYERNTIIGEIVNPTKESRENLQKMAKSKSGIIKLLSQLRGDQK